MVRYKRGWYLYKAELFPSAKGLLTMVTNVVKSGEIRMPAPFLGASVHIVLEDKHTLGSVLASCLMHLCTTLIVCKSNLEVIYLSVWTRWAYHYDAHSSLFPKKRKHVRNTRQDVHTYLLIYSVSQTLSVVMVLKFWGPCSLIILSMASWMYSDDLSQSFLVI